MADYVFRNIQKGEHITIQCEIKNSYIEIKQIYKS